MLTTDITQTIAYGRSDIEFRTPRHIRECALPHLGAVDRMLVRGMALAASRHIVSIHGLQHIHPAHDPFILAINHSCMRESLLVPSLLFLNRGGKLIHFLADWNYRVWPGVGTLYRRAGVVTVLRKPARPRALNFLKALYRNFPPPRIDARAHLMDGRSIGIFPEGQINRDSDRMLRGRHGAARLSLEVGVPVVPMGIRFTEAGPGQATRSTPAMELFIGAPIVPERPIREQASVTDVRAWHATIMAEIARLSGKMWTEGASRGR
jgi:1-acyl-sn-glycerol-3-phosphate acyltransferase